jgi:hypothetical protein
MNLFVCPALLLGYFRSFRILYRCTPEISSETRPFPRAPQQYGDRAQLQAGFNLVTNYHQPEKEMAVLVQVGVSYQSDLRKVDQITIEVAREVMREVEGGARIRALHSLPHLQRHPARARIHRPVLDQT